jgi:hypothetical protein
VLFPIALDASGDACHGPALLSVAPDPARPLLDELSVTLGPSGDEEEQEKEEEEPEVGGEAKSPPALMTGN